MSVSSRMITVSGRMVDPLAMRVTDISWPDIAHALSQINRWGGHTRHPWSVAQHSLVVAAIVEPEDALWALLHDAAEAYVCDLPRPLKYQPAMAHYRDAEAAVMAVILQAAGVRPSLMPAEVKAADDAVLVAEFIELMPRAPEAQLPQVDEALVKVAREWVRQDGLLSPRYVADLWTRHVLSLRYRTNGETVAEVSR